MIRVVGADHRVFEAESHISVFFFLTNTAGQISQALFLKHVSGDIFLLLGALMPLP